MANITIAQIEKLASKLSLSEQETLIQNLNQSLLTKSQKQILRPKGLCKGDFTVPQDFDSPLPDDILQTFEPS